METLSLSLTNLETFHTSSYFEEIRMHYPYIFILRY